MRSKLFNMNAFYKYKKVIDEKNKLGMWWNMIIFISLLLIDMVMKLLVKPELLDPGLVLIVVGSLILRGIWLLLKKRLKKAQDWAVILNYVVGYCFIAYCSVRYNGSALSCIVYGIWTVGIAITLLLAPPFLIMGQIEGMAAFLLAYVLAADHVSWHVIFYGIFMCAMSLTLGLLIWNVRLSKLIFENEVMYLTTGTDDVFLEGRANDLWNNENRGMVSLLDGKERKTFTFVFDVTHDRLTSVRQGNIFNLNLDMDWNEVEQRILRYVGDPNSYRSLEKFLNVAGAAKEMREGTDRKSMVASFNMPGGEKMWLDISMSYRSHPVSGAIINTVVLEDVTGDQVFMDILNRMIIDNYEAILCMEKGIRRGLLFLGFPDGTIKRQRCDDYESLMVDYVTQWVSDYDREKALKNGHLKHIFDRLTETDAIEIFLDEKKLDGLTKKKRFRATYLDEDKRFLLLTKQDVTDLINREKEAKDQLEKALAEAQQANKVKTEFLSRMSHEMRTPMNAIMGIASLVEDAGNDPKQLKNYVDKIKSSSDYLLQLINDVLDMSGISEGKLQIRNEECSFGEFLTAVNTLIEPMCEKKQLAYFTNSEIADNTILKMDKVRLVQVFSNILNNAVKYNKEGGIVEFDCYNMGLEKDNCYYRFVVKDNGIGMTEEFAAHVFEPFTQETATNRESLNGPGLGLSVAKGIVDAMGGTINLTSKPDVGTTVVVDLKFETTGRAKPAQQENRDDLTALKGRRILVVEDNEINRDIVNALLEKCGMLSFSAEDGQEAVEIFNGSMVGYFDAILMDIRMPRMNGLEATRAIRSMSRKDSDLPIIALTANAFTEDVEFSLSSGMTAHLSKPINPQVLYETLAKYICR